MAVHRTISTTNMTLVNSPTDLLKGIELSCWEGLLLFKNISNAHITINIFNTIRNVIKSNVIFTLVESVAFLKTIPATHIKMI